MATHEGPDPKNVPGIFDVDLGPTIIPGEYARNWAAANPDWTGPQPETRNAPEFLVREGLVLDFDRMLGDVDSTMERLYIAAKLSGLDDAVTRREVATAQETLEKDGGTFEPLSTLKKLCKDRVSGKFDQSRYDSILETFVELDHPPVLYDDAARFLYMLKQSGVPHVFMTYGVSSEWQRMKIAAAGYPAGVDLMETKDKGNRITEMRSPDGKFHFFRTLGGNASFLADDVCLLDDKPISFDNLPEDCHGFLINRPGEKLASQQGELPANVVPVSSLDELIIGADGRLRKRTADDPEPAQPRPEKVFYCFRADFPSGEQTEIVYRQRY